MPRIPKLTERVLARLSAAERKAPYPDNASIRQAWNIVLSCAIGTEPLTRSRFTSGDDLWRMTFILAFGNQPEKVWAERAEFARRNGLIARGVTLELPQRKGVQREKETSVRRSRAAAAGGRDA